MLWEAFCVFSRLKMIVEDVICGKCSVFPTYDKCSNPLKSRLGRTFLKPCRGHVFSNCHDFGEFTFSSKHPILSQFPLWQSSISSGDHNVSSHWKVPEQHAVTRRRWDRMSIMSHPNQVAIAYVLMMMTWYKRCWFGEVKVPRWKLRWPSQADFWPHGRVEKMNLSKLKVSIYSKSIKTR